MDKITRVLGLLASGMGVNAVCRENDVTADSLRDWIVLTAGHVNEFSRYLEHEMHLEQAQIGEFWYFIRKKEYLSEEELAAGQLVLQVGENQGDRRTFVAVLPESSCMHTRAAGGHNCLFGLLIPCCVMHKFTKKGTAKAG